MAEITTKNIRNVVLLGHGGSGKTSIAEAALYLTKGTDRLGKTTAGNTVCDYDPEEIKRGFSLTLSLAPVMWETSKINFIDTPGFFDFSGEVDAAVRVADAAVIALDGKAGVEVGAEIAWDKAQEAKIPCAFFVNKCDDPDADFEKVFNELHEKFGAAVCPLLVPVKNGKDVKFLNLISREAYTFDASGKRTNAPFNSDDEDIAAGYTDTLNEALAQTSEELLDKFFETAEITQEEAVEALHQGIIDGSIVPVFSGCATNLWGITFLLDTIHDSFPRPTAKKVEQIIDGDSFKDKPIETDGECSLFVFKTIADPFVGKMTFFKVMSGTLTNDLTMKNVTSGTTEKMAHIYTMRGKKQTEVTSLCCGDIGMIAKLAGTNTNDTLTVSSDFEYRKIAFPHPYYTMAITPAAKGDEDKISTGIARLLEEDKTLAYENNAETKQMTISGLGDMQLDVLVARMKSRYGTTVLLETPKIAYRETIKGTSDVEGKHKKQSGGSGQYGHVKMRFSHGDAEGLTFTQSVVGGTVPKNFYPAVEKGLLEAMTKGVLAGYPVVNLAADLYDGSYHPVDSNEISFKLAARLAYKEGLPKAKPILLEPIGSLKVTVPDSLVGDVIGDLNKRRGRVLGMNPHERKVGYTVLEADVPKGEMTDYTIALRAMSQGRGSFDFTIDRYEEVPASVAQKIIADAKVDAED
ncbi:MAG: elongation factor G [Eubacteriales bacterium]|nr:elongation factor G [Clostridia bacterium]MDY2844880.1 elongation factor G [Eubacteriales bacterium]